MGVELTEHMKKLLSNYDKKQLGKRGLTNEEHEAKRVARLEREEHKTVMTWCLRNEVECGHALTYRKSRYTVGWPDFSIPYQGQTLYGEMKCGRNKLSKDQNRIVRELGSTGTYVQIWDDAGHAIRAIRNFLEGLGWRMK
jgi:hypothetical protein